MMTKNETCKQSHPKTRILLWADLNYNDTEEISKTESIPEIERILCRALPIKDSEPRRTILLELYTNAVLFCRQQKFNKEQTSVLLSIVKNVHKLNTETSLNSMDQCFTYCSELLLCHSVRRPPFSINLFTSEQVTDVMKYVINTYMRHYMLYKYVFTPQMYLDLSLTYSGMAEDPATEPPASSEEVTVTENETEKKDEASEQGSASTEILPTDAEASTQDPPHKAALRTIVQKEVKEEVMRLTAQLQKRFQESTDRLNTALSALETSMQSKQMTK